MGGPRLPTYDLVQRLQAQVKSGFYVDSAYLIKKIPTGTFDDNNTELFNDSEIPLDGCSFTDTPSMEKWKDYADLGEINAEIRWGRSPQPEKGDTIRVVGRFETLQYPNVTFEIAGIRNRDGFGWMVALRAVSV